MSNFNRVLMKDGTWFRITDRAFELAKSAVNSNLVRVAEFDLVPSGVLIVHTDSFYGVTRQTEESLKEIWREQARYEKIQKEIEEEIEGPDWMKEL